MNNPSINVKTQKSRDDPEKGKKPRKPSYLKDRKTSSGITFGVQMSFYFFAGQSVRRQELCGAHRVNKVYVLKEKERFINDKRTD